MKKLINAIRDFLYILTDYGLIITVAVIMMGVLAWRFDLLFNRSIEKEAIANIPNTTQNEIPIANNEENDQENNNNEVPGQEQNEENQDNNTETPVKQGDIIATVEIPAGSFPSKIGDILVNSNLITDKNEFLNRSVEMGLDTKLQSGSFEIAIGTNLDDIIKILAKTN